MANFVVLTSTDGFPTVVNLEIASMIFEVNGVTRICFPGSDDDYVEVKQAVHELSDFVGAKDI